MIYFKNFSFICGCFICLICILNFLKSLSNSSIEYPDREIILQIQGNNSSFQKVLLTNKIFSRYEKILKSSMKQVNTKYIILDNINRSMPIWQQFLNTSKSYADFDEGEKYNLVAIVQLRVYKGDKAEIGVPEVKQWIHYMFLAGVEHIFICDHYHELSEQIRKHISKYIIYGLITYVPWNKIKNPIVSQIKCYRKVMILYKNYHSWHIAFDIDEYPFSFLDHQELFLQRYLRSLSEDASQILVENFIILGERIKNQSLLINRFNRMTRNPPNLLTKCIYRPNRISKVQVHNNLLKRGNTLHADVGSLRMMHYWGDRAKDNDEGGLLKTTIKTVEMGRVWSKRLEDSLIIFGEEDLLQKYSN